MAETMTAHLFKCAPESASYRIYGLTTDKTGKNLPLTECPTGWVFEKTETVTEGEVGNIALNTKGAFADLKNQGYHLARIFTKLAPNA
jgi:hypothetical protein